MTEVVSDLKGMMFNSAGPHPHTTPNHDLNNYQNDFIQYRSSGGLESLGGDPLTGLSHSLNTQKLVLSGLEANVWAANELDAQHIPLNNAIQQRLLTKVLNQTVPSAKNNMRQYGYYIPPTIGRMVETPAKLTNGQDVGANLSGQHRIVNLINGIEARKYAKASALLQQTTTQGNPQDYLGPVFTVQE